MSSSEAYTDVVELCALLQCLGFTVKSLSSSGGNTSQAGTRTVVVKCQSSGLNVVLETPGTNCSCPSSDLHQNSRVRQVSGVTGKRQLDKELDYSRLGSLPKLHRDRLTKELHNIIRCIKQNNEVDPERMRKEKSASMTELNTPEKRLFDLKSEKPARYRSLGALAAAKEAKKQLPQPRPLQRTHLLSESTGDDGKPDSKRKMCERQRTFTLPSPPGSPRHRNKILSPMQAFQTSVFDSLRAAEKSADDLCKNLGTAIKEYVDQDKHDDSSMLSFALDISAISISKDADSKHKFASSPSISGIMTTDDFTKSRVERLKSASTSTLVPKNEVKLSRQLGHIPPTTKIKKPITQDKKSKLNCVRKPPIVPPITTVPPSAMTEPGPGPSTSNKKRLSDVKSFIPRPANKK